MFDLSYLRYYYFENRENWKRHSCDFVKRITNTMFHLVHHFLKCNFGKLDIEKQNNIKIFTT